MGDVNDDDDNNMNYNNDDNIDDDGNYTEYDSFENYQATTVDPGPWLLIGTALFCLLVMFLIVPLMVWYRLRRRRRKKRQQAADPKREQLLDADESHNLEAAPAAAAVVEVTKDYNQHHQQQQPILPPTAEKITLQRILSWDSETRKIIKLAIPYTVSGFTSSFLDNLGLILVSQYYGNSSSSSGGGVKAVSAFLLVPLLCDLVDGMIHGALDACTTLCAHAVGAGQSNLAGRYVQMALWVFLLGNIPIGFIWYTYMYDIILYLGWGDEVTAQLAQEFVRHYFPTYLIHGLSSGLWQLLEVANHTKASAVITIAEGVTGVVGILVLSAYDDDDGGQQERNNKDDESSFLVSVAWIYNGTALFYLFFGLLWSYCKGWLKPFQQGLFGSCALFGFSSSSSSSSYWKTLWKQAIPLSVGSFWSNAEWTVLTIFASHLGPAEVTTWAMLGQIWEVLYDTTSGMNDAAELRVANYLGNNHARQAQLSAYKSLSLVMILSTIISVVCFSFSSSIPEYYTNDATIQGMLRELLPFVGVANITMAFGMHCWSLIGAQGKYKLATRITLVSSWLLSVPLAAVYVFLYHFDLQGLTSAVVMGYVTTGAALSYVLLSTKWKKTALKIHDEYMMEEEEEEDTDSEDSSSSDDDDEEEEEDKENEENGDFLDDIDDDIFASLRQNKSQVAKTKARNFVRLLSMPPYKKSGIVLGNRKNYNKEGRSTPAAVVVMIRPWSPLRNQMKEGDSILAIDGLDVRRESAQAIIERFVQARKTGCEIAVTCPDIGGEEETSDYFGIGSSSNTTTTNNNNAALVSSVDSMVEDDEDPPPEPLGRKLSRHFFSSRKKKEEKSNDNIYDVIDMPKVMIMVKKPTNLVTGEV